MSGLTPSHSSLMCWERISVTYAGVWTVSRYLRKAGIGSRVSWVSPSDLMCMMRALYPLVNRRPCVGWSGSNIQLAYESLWAMMRSFMFSPILLFVGLTTGMWPRVRLLR